MEGNEDGDGDEVRGYIGRHSADEEADDDDALVHGNSPGALGAEVKCVA